MALHHGTTVFDRCSFSNSSSFGNGGSDVPHQHGGGGAIYNIGGHLVLKRSRFLNSTCSDPPGAAPGSTGGHNGGAVLSMRGKVETDECEFVGGAAGQAGALYLFLYASLTSRNTRFVDNHARCIVGNASSSSSSSSASAVASLRSRRGGHNGCTWASGTGGAIFMDRGAALIINATFERNVADLAGGALYAWNSNKLNNVSLVGGQLHANQALTQWGGAVANWHSRVSLNKTMLAGNRAAQMGGALWTDAESSSNLTGCTLTTATNGSSSAADGSITWSHPHGSTILAQHNTLLVPTQRQASHAAVARDFAGCTIDHGGVDVRVGRE